MAQRKVFICDKCKQQTPDKQIVQVRAEGERCFDGVESYNVEYHADWCPVCAAAALRDLMKRYERATKVVDGYPVVDWMQAHKV